MQKYIVSENGIGYILGEEGLYYPDLRFLEGTHYPIVRYGRMRKVYLQEYRKGMYMELILNGKLNGQRYFEKETMISKEDIDFLVEKSKNIC